MFLKIIGNNNLVGKVSFFILFIAVVLFKYFFSNHNYLLIENNFFINDLKDVSFILNCVFLLLVSVGFNNMIYEKGVIKKNNIITAFVFLTIHPFLYDFKILITGVIFLFFLEKIIEIVLNEKIDNQIFYSALFVSTMSVFNIYFLLYSIVPFFVLFLFKNNLLRYIVIYLIGSSIPFFVLFFLKILFEIDLRSQFNFNETIKIDLSQFKYIIIVLTVSLFSFIEIFNWINKKSIRSRKSFFVIIIISIITILFFVFNVISYNFFALLFSFPLSLFLSNYYLYSKRILIKQFLFFIFIFGMFLSYYNL